MSVSWAQNSGFCMADFDTVLPPLATLVAFEAAFRHRNFTRAADELFQSQTTVSRRVRELEADLGVRLFDRHRYDATPTRHAEELITSVRLALSELAATAERIRREASDDRTLTVLSSLALTSAMVVPAVGAFQREHPDVDVRVVSACEPIETTRERFDVAIQYGPAVSERFRVHVIADEAVFPVCSPEFAAELPHPLTLEALGRLPLIDVTYVDPAWMTWAHFFETFEALPAYTGAKLTMNSYAVGLDVAERGDGVAIGWERSVRTRIEAGTLVEIPGLRPPLHTPINAYLAPTSTQHVPRFIELLEQHASAAPA